jgi:predicted protein tyrosine phosphatase
VAPELNSRCNLQNTGFKAGDLIFVMQTLTKQKLKKKKEPNKAVQE